MLSKRRAESVRNFLLAEFQIEETRLIVSPYGEGQPLETNKTAEGRAKNRRVEFIRVE
jgi:outer membrane protein OmpA-like peptidoglycan-associated protein